jgi:hypothetical protein
MWGAKHRSPMREANGQGSDLSHSVNTDVQGLRAGLAESLGTVCATVAYGRSVDCEIHGTNPSQS